VSELNKDNVKPCTAEEVLDESEACIGRGEPGKVVDCAIVAPTVLCAEGRCEIEGLTGTPLDRTI